MGKNAQTTRAVFATANDLGDTELGEMLIAHLFDFAEANPEHSVDIIAALNLYQKNIEANEDEDEDVVSPDEVFDLGGGGQE